MKPRTHWLRCDHPRTPENTSLCGRKPRCKICYRAYKAQYDAKRGHRRNPPRRADKPFLTPFGPDYALRMAEARVEYDAWLIRQEQLGKGGRPKNRRSDFRADPLDDLLRASA